MTNELLIEEKKYLPSTALAARFSYTSDYLAKLAREGKVDSTRVGRQWFINEESLQKFVAERHEQKSVRREELRQERMSERQQHQETTALAVKSLTPKVFSIEIPTALHSLAQAVAVVMCGVLVGSLGFLFSQQDSEMASVRDSARSVAIEMTGALVPDELVLSTNWQLAALDLSFFWDWLFPSEETMIVESGKVDSPVTKNSDTLATPTPPTVPFPPSPPPQQAIVMLDADRSTTSLDSVRESFSDEVEVTYDGNDTGIIKPIFREQTDESYRFLLVPVSESKENQYE